MANENRVDQPWKKLLEDESALAGEELPDKAVAWQKLHHRLHLQPRRTSVIRYWVTAACLMLALIIPFTVFHDDNSSLVKDVTSGKEIPALSNQLPPAVSKTAGTKRLPVMGSAKKDAIKIKTKNDSHNVAVNSDPGLVVNNKEENTGINVSTPPDVDSSITTSAIANVQPRKQLKVVHVNEIGDPVTESSVSVHTAEPHSFELQIGKEEVVTNTAVSLNRSRLAVITIKTSPTN